MSVLSQSALVPGRAWCVLGLACALLLGGCSTTPAPGPSRSVASSLSDEHAHDIAIHALGLVGTPYRYGGNTPDGGFDCSGLVGYVFRDAAGVTLPRTSNAMSGLGQRKLAVDSLQSGDLVFFASGRKVDHVGIYVGERRFVHAPNSGGTVRLDSLDGPWWREHFVFGKRVL